MNGVSCMKYPLTEVSMSMNLICCSQVWYNKMGSPSAVLVTMDRTHKRSHTGQKLKSGSLLDAIASKVCQPTPYQRCSYPKRKWFDSYLMHRLTNECHIRGETRLIKSGKCLTRPSKVIIRLAKHKLTRPHRVTVYTVVFSLSFQFPRRPA